MFSTNLIHQIQTHDQLNSAVVLTLMQQKTEGLSAIDRVYLEEGDDGLSKVITALQPLLPADDQRWLDQPVLPPTTQRRTLRAFCRQYNLFPTAIQATSSMHYQQGIDYLTKQTNSTRVSLDNFSLAAEKFYLCASLNANDATRAFGRLSAGAKAPVINDFPYFAAKCALEGAGCQADPHKALQWFALGQNQHPAMTFMTAYCYSNGIGTDADPSKASRLLERVFANEDHYQDRHFRQACFKHRVWLWQYWYDNLERFIAPARFTLLVNIMITRDEASASLDANDHDNAILAFKSAAILLYQYRKNPRELLANHDLHHLLDAFGNSGFILRLVIQQQMLNQQELIDFLLTRKAAADEPCWYIRGLVSQQFILACLELDPRFGQPSFIKAVLTHPCEQTQIRYATLLLRVLFESSSELKVDWLAHTILMQLPATQRANWHLFNGISLPEHCSQSVRHLYETIRWPCLKLQMQSDAASTGCDVKQIHDQLEAQFNSMSARWSSYAMEVLQANKLLTHGQHEQGYFDAIVAKLNDIIEWINTTKTNQIHVTNRNLLCRNHYESFLLLLSKIRNADDLTDVCRQHRQLLNDLLTQTSSLLNGQKTYKYAFYELTELISSYQQHIDELVQPLKDFADERIKQKNQPSNNQTFISFVKQLTGENELWQQLPAMQFMIRFAMVLQPLSHKLKSYSLKASNSHQIRSLIDTLITVFDASKRLQSMQHYQLLAAQLGNMIDSYDGSTPVVLRQAVVGHYQRAEWRAQIRAVLPTLQTVLTPYLGQSQQQQHSLRTAKVNTKSSFA